MKASSAFRREAWALSRLQSPHIARMFEFLTGPPFGMALVMEYIEGELLSDVLKRARFSVEDAIGLGVGTLSGIAEMQGMGIIHRDIKAREHHPSAEREWMARCHLRLQPLPREGQRRGR